MSAPPSAAPTAPTAPSAQDKAAAEQRKAEGNTAFAAKRYAEAIGLYTQAIDLDPREPTYLTNRAAAHMGNKRYAPALDDCLKAEALCGESVPAKIRVRTARCYLNLGQASQAQRVLQSLTPATEAETKQVEQLRVQVGKLQDHLDSYAQFKANKEWMMASIALDRAAASLDQGTPTPSAWRLSQAELALLRGQLQSAASGAMDILRQDSGNSEALLLRARIMLAQGDLAKATAHAQAALRSDPDYSQARTFLKKSKRLERAKAEGNAAFKEQRFDDAVATYSEAIALADENADEDGPAKGFKATIHSNRASAYAKLGKHEQVVSDCDAALELDKNYTKALRTRARAYAALEQYEASVSDFKAALEDMKVSGNQADIDSVRRELRSAEIDLKRSKQKDYYKILGVSKTATEVEIKKAFRTASLKHHPDKGGDSETFKLCNEAYGILSDPAKRRRYDAGAENPEDESADFSPFGGMGGMGGMGGGVDLSDILGGMGGGFGGMGGGMGGMPSGFGGMGGGYGGSSFRF